MNNTHDYIVKYGDKTFDELPFGAADSFCLCQAFYMPVLNKTFETLNKKEVPFSEFAMKTFDLFGSKYKKVGIVLSPQVSVRLVQMGRSKRFGEMKVVDFCEVFETEPAVQFAAATILLPDGTIVIPYRGTDDSVIGWKEDLDLLAKKGIPSHELAVNHLEKAAREHDGDIIICGHSKGGNLALFAALNCSEKTRKRIRTLYNVEGPGFHNYEMYATKAYRDLLPRYQHFVPTSSFIGMFLAHDDDFKVVKNAVHIGPLQHDLSFWLTQENEAALAPGLTLQGKINYFLLKKVYEMIPEEYYPSVEKVAAGLVKGMGQLYLTGLVQNFGSAVKGMAQAWKGFDEDTKTEFKSAFKGAPGAVVEAVREAAAPAEKAAPDLQPAAV